MVHETSTLAPSSVLRQRRERRVSVHLPLKVRGRDSRGIAFEEETSSENLCRSGAAFLTRFDVAVGSNLEIYIPLSNPVARRASNAAIGGSLSRYPASASESDFATQGRVVHVTAGADGERLVGVQFTGPRFQRMFRSESAA
jgi:hypothetical protein